MGGGMLFHGSVVSGALRPCRLQQSRGRVLIKCWAPLRSVPSEALAVFAQSPPWSSWWGRSHPGAQVQALGQRLLNSLLLGIWILDLSGPLQEKSGFHQRRLLKGCWVSPRQDSTPIALRPPQSHSPAGPALWTWP